MPSVAIIGTRGYPSFYGGFETAIRKIAPYLADQGWDVTVYGRRGALQSAPHDFDTRIINRVTLGLETKSLSTLSYGLTASLDAAARRPDVALVMNVANGYFLPLLRARGIPTLVNVDGIEWKRAKWSPLAKRVFRMGAKGTARWATRLIFDARAIESNWKNDFDVEGTFIPYGGDTSEALPLPEGMKRRKYVLLVARFVPENSVPEFFAAVPHISARYPVVIVGSSGYGDDLDDAARRLSDDNPAVTWLGHVNNDRLLHALWQHAGVYFHGHSVGGTNPALVQAMALGAPVVARDTLYNREVLGTSSNLFVSANAEAIATAVLQMMDDEATLERASGENCKRAQDFYSWAQVCEGYEGALRGLLR